MSPMPDEAHEHGFHEIHLTVWNPNEEADENTVSSVTIDIIFNEEKLSGIHENLPDQIQRYVEITDVDEESTQIESYLQQYVPQMIDKELIFDVYVDRFDITSVEEFEQQLESNPDFEFFPF